MPTQPQPYILATAGHVDHGKSTLVRLLTGTNPDRLPEEKERHLSIVPGFAEMSLPEVPDENGLLYRLGIVDVPGHENFVRNMIAGVGSVDLALLVVAADDGWMPQTEEHLQILTYLGVRHGVVALTKIDKVDSARDVSTAQAQIRRQLRDTPLSEAPMVATSATTGRGMGELRTALTEAVCHTPPPRDVNKARLPIDRVFCVKGAGTVVTGTLAGGTLHREQHVIVQPVGLKGRIRVLQTHHREAERAAPGSRVALNLPELRRSNHHDDLVVQRGHLVTATGLGEVSDTCDVVVWRSPRLLHRHHQAETPVPLRDNAGVLVHHGCACLRARLRLIDASELAPGERALAQLRFEEAVFTFAGDRFILRDGSQRRTLAGGLVLDPIAARRGLRQPARREALAKCAAAPEQPTAFIKARLAQHRAAERASLLIQSNFSIAEIDAAVQQLTAAGQALAFDDLIIKPAWWQTWCGCAREAIDEVHRCHPERLGLDLASLRHQLAGREAPPRVIGAVIAALCNDGFTRTASTIGRTGHQPALPSRLQQAGQAVRRRLNATPLNPPSRRELAGDDRGHQALKFLLISGEAVELNHDVVISAAALAQATETVGAYLHRHGAATVSEIKQVLNSSRRITVPLLEKLARDGITQRQGDRHMLLSDRLTVTDRTSPLSRASHHQ